MKESFKLSSGWTIDLEDNGYQAWSLLVKRPDGVTIESGLVHNIRDITQITRKYGKLPSPVFDKFKNTRSCGMKSENELVKSPRTVTLKGEGANKQVGDEIVMDGTKYVIQSKSGAVAILVVPKSFMKSENKTFTVEVEKLEANRVLNPRTGARSSSEASEQAIVRIDGGSPHRWSTKAGLDKHLAELKQKGYTQSGSTPTIKFTNSWHLHTAADIKACAKELGAPVPSQETITKVLGMIKAGKADDELIPAITGKKSWNNTAFTNGQTRAKQEIANKLGKVENSLASIKSDFRAGKLDEQQAIKEIVKDQNRRNSAGMEDSPSQMVKKWKAESKA